MSNVITQVEVVVVPDPDPDLSYLDQTDAQMGDGFEAKARERKTSYGESWQMVGVYAEASITINGVAQKIKSGGLWGTESDSSPADFAEIAREEHSELRDALLSIGFTAEQVDQHQPKPLEIQLD